jgi:hypothetical protein
MLEAAGRAKRGELTRRAREQIARMPENERADTRTGYSVVPLFNAPATQRGELVELAGVARSVLKIQLDADDAGARRRLGFDHYYQLSLFTEDSQSNPLTFCVRELPKGMPVGEGPQFGEPVAVAGFFLKKWSYRISVDPDIPQRPDEEAGPPTVGPAPGRPRSHLDAAPVRPSQSLGRPDRGGPGWRRRADVARRRPSPPPRSGAQTPHRFAPDRTRPAPCRTPREARFQPSR